MRRPTGLMLTKNAKSKEASLLSPRPRIYQIYWQALLLLKGTSPQPLPGGLVSPTGAMRTPGFGNTQWRWPPARPGEPGPQTRGQTL